MKKTERVNIGGYAFTLEEDAYDVLDGYIESIRSTYSKDAFSKEIVNDIEERIAELFIEKKGKGAVVDIATVNEVIGRIGTPSELAQDNSGQGKEDTAQSGSGNIRKKRIFRDVENRKLGGVCSGIALYFNTDTVFIRLFFVLLAALGIFTFYTFPLTLTVVAAYVVMWIIIPAAKTVEQKCIMTGSPMNLDEFHEKSSTPKKAPEKEPSPVLHTCTRIAGSIIGIILMITGISGLIGCTLIDLFKDLAISNFNIFPGACSNYENSLYISLVSASWFWWMSVIITALFSVWLLYNGTLLTFSLKAPKWKPGTVIFILWLIVIIAFMVMIARAGIEGISTFL